MDSSSEQTKKEKKLPYYQHVDGFCLPGMFSADAFRSALAYKPRDDDLFIVTYPKCGTTWVQNIVGCIFRNGKPFETAMEFFTSTPFLEMMGGEIANTMKRPGALKVHLPYHMTPMSDKAKYIFVARNPKDCCVSFYHHTENILGYRFADGEFDDFFELFIDGKVDFGDYFDCLLSWYEHRNDPNVLFITYEQLKKDTRTYVLKIAEFIGTEYREALEKDEQLLKDVIYHSSFGFMKEHLNKIFADLGNIPKELIINNPDIPPHLRALFGGEEKIWNSDPSKVQFVRKGIVGDWRNYFTPEQNDRMEKRFREKTAGTYLAEIWKDDM